MSWYYVGPDAKPVGPISLEDLQSRRASGAISPETYVIEAPAGSAPKEWRRFRDVFPPTATLPPIPASALAEQPTTMGIPHPVFPTAPPHAPSPGGPVFTGAHPSVYRLPPTKGNPWCSWGFGLSLASLPLMLCGVGPFIAVAALVASLVGLVQISRHHDQHGRGLAISGVIISILSLLFTALLIFAVMSNSLRNSLQMSTEQTSNDSDTR